MSGLALFTAGLASSFHCVGMCGGFPLLLDRGAKGGATVRHLLYNLARVNTLVAIGALSGALGSSLVTVAPFGVLERILPLVAGMLMIVIGLEMLGIIRPWTEPMTRLMRSFVRRSLGGTLASDSPAAPLALGVFNAFLPCHLIYAFAAYAASTASATEGMWIMLWFGLGTVPAMFSAGLLHRWLSAGTRHRLTTASALLVLAFAGVTLWRGFFVAGQTDHLLRHGPHTMQGGPH